MALGLFGLDIESREEREFFEKCFQLMKETQREYRQFESRLNKIYWEKELDMLELMLVMSKEAIQFVGKNLLETETDRYIWNVLSHIYGKAFTTTSAILILMRSGHTDDAFSLWRSLHELCVVIMFICSDRDHMSEVALKYWLHAVVKHYKMMLGFRNSPIEIPPHIYPPEAMSELETEYKGLVDRFGKNFKEDYGWANSIMANKVKFVDLEAKVGLQGMRPMYQLASASLHPNSYGVFNRVALQLPGPHVGILLGRSNVGQQQSGDLTASSFLYINQVLLIGMDDPLCKLTMSSLEKLAVRICELFRRRQSIPA